MLAKRYRETHVADRNVIKPVDPADRDGQPLSFSVLSVLRHSHRDRDPKAPLCRKIKFAHPTGCGRRLRAQW